jgi:hypothetical protein
MTSEGSQQYEAAAIQTHFVRRLQVSTYIQSDLQSKPDLQRPSIHPSIHRPPYSSTYHTWLQLFLLHGYSPQKFPSESSDAMV